MDEVHLDAAQGGVPGDAGAVRRGRGERAWRIIRAGCRRRTRRTSSACTGSSATRCARWATSPPATASGSRSRTCSSRMPRPTPPIRCVWPSEIAAIDHPHVCGLLDFSHAYIMAQFRGTDYLETLAGVRARGQSPARARFARPPDQHRRLLSLRRADRVRHGRSALPMGWGDIPWDAILPGLRVAAGHGDDRRAAGALLGGARASAPPPPRRFMDMVNGAQARAA